MIEGGIDIELEALVMLLQTFNITQCSILESDISPSYLFEVFEVMKDKGLMKEVEYFNYLSHEDDEHNYEDVCQVIERFKCIKHLVLSMFDFHANPSRLLNAIADSNITVLDLRGNESFVPFIGDIGAMLPTSKTLKKFSFC
jgi:hypothetical protein